MKWKSRIIFFCAIALAFSYEQPSQSVAPVVLISNDYIRLAKKHWRLAHKKRVEESKKRDNAISLLREDLAKDWTSLIVVARQDIECTGAYFNGFKILRENGTYSVTPWAHSQGGERTGQRQSLTEDELETLLSETVLYYLVANLSVHPSEKMSRNGLRLTAENYAEMFKEYVTIGGSVDATTNTWMEIRVTNREGIKSYLDLFDYDVPADFGRWVMKYGAVENNE